ncbi:spindolin [Pseudoalteromonas sp. A25]|uniref:lytic polysaccharide monooxygenase n=1 Tax=Pseudoalteromonas sp. A25 TaxID=116092 RepID=UPI001260F092|nr:lytic polysaccharide monooxygenase [Pseudoalteromonas sp. A25]BBN83655.1 spindolin [Pseudoalteromonas sp. A25]
MNKMLVNTPLLVATVSTALLSSLSFNVNAHGYMDFPKARQSICEAQGGYWWPEDGSNIPNQGCRAAFLESGYVQFIQEHEFSVNTANYNDQAAVEANVPDGALCAGGDNAKRGMNLPSEYWQSTEITPNANGEVAVRFRATTPHNPSFWKFYITKPEFNRATDTLRWEDLELVTELGNVEFVKDPDGKRFYEMKVSIPQNRVGDAILYTRWQRIDVVGEGFYNCSDITIVRDTGPVNWTSAGYFVAQGQQAQVGDTVWARVFDGTGKELVSKSLKVSDFNQGNWAEQLAQMLNLDHASIMQVGVKQSDDQIVFDPQNLLSNEVYVSNENYTYNLTIQAAPDNTPPKIHSPEPLVMDELSTATLHVHAFDDEQQDLTYQWQVPSELTWTGSGATIELTAPEVSADMQYSITVTVSDGQLSTSADVSITVKDSDQSQYPAWSQSKTYVGGDKVSHKGKNYQAKWWTRGEEPGSALVWLKL